MPTGPGRDSGPSHADVVQPRCQARWLGYSWNALPVHHFGGAGEWCRSPWPQALDRPLMNTCTLKFFLWTLCNSECYWEGGQDVHPYSICFSGDPLWTVYVGHVSAELVPFGICRDHSSRQIILCFEGTRVCKNVQRGFTVSWTLLLSQSTL